MAVSSRRAFLASGSGSMLSEAIHSLADTANQALLYVGIRASERPPDTAFPYGYGGDRYFYSLMSAVGIFVLGCGVTVYHGIHDLRSPPALSLSWVTVAVLAIALVVEGLVLIQAIRAVWERKGDETFFAYLGTTTDPTVAAVLLEDSIACVGVLVAAAGIGLSAVTGNPTFDAMGAIVIGLMLGGVAIWLGVKNRKLLLGPSIPASIEAQVVEYLQRHPAVDRVRDIRTRVVGADKFRVHVQIDFNGRHIGVRLAGFVEDRCASLAAGGDSEAFAADFGEAMTCELALEIDRIERELAEKFPRLTYVDLEAD